MTNTKTVKTVCCAKCNEEIEVSSAVKKELDSSKDWSGALCEECWEKVHADYSEAFGMWYVNVNYRFEDGVLSAPIGRPKKPLRKYQTAANPDSIRSRVMTHDLKRVLGTAGFGCHSFL